MIQCQFEQNPIYPRCEAEATDWMITKVGVVGARSVRHRYCAQHRGFVMQQLKGTYVRVVKWGKINPEKT